MFTAFFFGAFGLSKSLRVSVAAASALLMAWAYMFAVVLVCECPSRAETVLKFVPAAISSDAFVCHYGIITTNGKSLDFQGGSAFVAVYSIPFPKLKYGEKIDKKRRELH